MCGITGFISKITNKEEIIKKMADRIAHRGPDDYGYYVDEHIALGHRRLSIIDLDNGKQPMLSKDKNYVLVFNGEIYNYQELRQELEKKHCKFITASDTEVLLQGYIKWGADELLSKLRGMYAFAIWDKKKETLFCARDHFGIKPFYYYKKGHVFMFASEIKAFLDHPEFKKELNQDLLSPYLEFSYNPTNETFFKNVYCLEPGTYMTVKDGKISKKRYYALKWEKDNRSFEELTDELSQKVHESVAYHKISDVPVGSFLSSGVDSSYIVSVLKPQKNYTIGYDRERYDETSYTTELTKELGLENIIKTVSKEEFVDAIDKVLYHLDEPLSDPSVVSLYYLAKMAKKDVKVILSGEGADEFFLGYNTYMTDAKYSFFKKIPYCIRHLMALLVSVLPDIKGRSFLISQGMKVEDGYVGVNRLFDRPEVKKILKNYKYDASKNPGRLILHDYQNEDDIVKMNMVDISCWLPKDILQKADKMSMANGLEARTPLVDKEIAEIARRIPYAYKVSKNRTKIIFREAAKKDIPTSVYDKRKLGFPVPLREWMREDDLYNQIKSTIEKDFASEFINQKYVLKLLENHKLGKQDNYRKVWIVYAFLRWYEIFFIENV